MVQGVHLATKTLQAIEQAFQEDQGVEFRGHLKKLYPLADDIYSQNSDPFRSHLGASLIGRKCTRELWYAFRWAKSVIHMGRIVRLFNRGHAEEPRFVALLLMIGCQVWQYDDKGKQFKISDVYGHFGGSLDGVATGIPDIPIGEPCLTEFKTHSEKSFIKLRVDGVKIAKPEHYVQMQTYMHKMDLKYALYMAVNKNDDELYAEIIYYDQDVGPQHIRRAYHIVSEVEAPKRISTNPAWFECKFCDYKGICHGKDIPAQNCRTCMYSTPLIDGSKQWHCRLHLKDLDTNAQMLGCQQFSLNPQIKKMM